VSAIKLSEAINDRTSFDYFCRSNSLSRHLSQRLQTALVETEGISFNIDMPEELKGISVLGLRTN